MTSAMAQTGSWTMVDSVHVAEQSLYGGVARTTDQAWAVGSTFDNAGNHRSFVRHFFRGQWANMVHQPFSSDQDTLFDDIASPADDSVWIAGEVTRNGVGSGEFSHWNGHAWYTHDLGARWSIAQISAISTDNVWFLAVSSDNPKHSFQGAYVHWDGRRFWRGALPAFPTGHVRDAYWVEGNRSIKRSDPPVLMHYDGTRFVVVSTPRHGPGEDAAYAADQTVVRHTGTDSAIVGLGFEAHDEILFDLYSYDAGTWTFQQRVHGLPQASTADGAGGTWILVTYYSGSTGQNLLQLSGNTIVRNVRVPSNASTRFTTQAITLRPYSRDLVAVGERDANDTLQAQIRQYSY